MTITTNDSKKHKKAKPNTVLESGACF